MDKDKRYFLFHYITKTAMGNIMSHGNVKVADFQFPSELWLKEVAIPQMVKKQMSPAQYAFMMGGNFVIVSWQEFGSEEDFTNFIGGHDITDELNAMFA